MIAARRAAVSWRRWALPALAAACVLMGLATRRRAEWFPQVVATYGGDVLWAAMMYWLIAMLRSRRPAAQVAALALAVASTVEASQLLQVEPLRSIRDTTVGALVLGQGFLVSDLVAYTAGVALATVLDLVLLHRQTPPAEP